MNGLIVLVPYSAGQDFYEEDAYLPVYVATQDKDLALMAVAYEACVNYRYVAFCSSDETEEDWQERSYPGTLEAPVVELPFTEEAYEIPEPGDCFCCASLHEYQVLSLEEMAKWLQSSPDDFLVMYPAFDGPDDDTYEEMLEQFDRWARQYLSIEVKNFFGIQASSGESEEEIPLSEAIDQLKDLIEKALKQGYNYAEIAKLLTKQGIEVNAALLKSHFDR